MRHKTAIRRCNLCQKEFLAGKFERFCNDCKDESKRIQGDLNHIIVKKKFQGKKSLGQTPR